LVLLYILTQKARSFLISNLFIFRSQWRFTQQMKALREKTDKQSGLTIYRSLI